ncbi:MAG: hypothetical protein ACK5JM_07310 [Rhodoblastus sp.]
MPGAQDRPPSGVIDHAEQYRMLREEILSQVRDTRRLETLTLGALALFYTWTLTHGTAAGGRAIYWLAPAMTLLASVRAWVALARIAEIAAYLREIEIASFGRIAEHGTVLLPRPTILDQKFKLSDLWRADIQTYAGNPPGWEQHIENYGSRLIGRSALAFWLLLFLFTFFAAIFMPDLAATPG